ncbi:conserved oligomeric Golgi complex subunit 7 isoform X1 [Schistocerca americana]|uniref:conserved oligomeric Golgi complex subunit 7 isoform X1 n=1 Tax=Schistocerca americana TaxID=7009 RepID=UPI001F4FD378|nr:conserved oligomeric Golgi complex subunit 7 isoform X1 [Schistocerca americana]
MDISAFSEDNFDVKEWINKTFRRAEAQENRDAFASSLVMKLQLYVQQVNSALEDTSQQILQSLPRIMRDTEILQQEAMLLGEKMNAVKKDIEKVEQDTGQSMATLEHIDHLKTQLQAAKQALHEADNWTILATDMEEAFESGDMERIASKLVSMQQSLAVLANVPDYEDRKLQLEGLKNRLEALTSPQLVQAFTSSSVDQSLIYVQIFTSIGRLPQLLKYYHKCQRGALLHQWASLVEAEDGGVHEWLRQLYDSLLSGWHERLRWCSQVFGAGPARSTLLALFADVLANLEPSPNLCIDAALKQRPPSDQLSFLLSLKQLTSHFANNLHSVTDAPAVKADDSSEAELILSLAQAVYLPYVTYVAKYSTFEQQTLSPQLSAIESNKQDLMDTIQELGQSIPRVVSIISEANKRCLQFTEGCGYCGFIKAIQAFLGDYLDRYRAALKRLDQQKGDHEHWNMFQMCLTLLQNVGELLSQVKQMGADLVRSIQDTSQKLQAQNTSPFMQYKQLLLSPDGVKELDNLVVSIQEGGEISIVEPLISSLNKLCSDVHHTTFQVIFEPISSQLEHVQKAPAWSSGSAPSVAADLPDFSFTPQEYITQIGQYLMTLPQHLEPFLLRDNPSLTLALRVADSEYQAMSENSEAGVADALLGIIARGTCQMYCENILGICELSTSGCRQLATDIDYLGNVLEDLGLALSEHLTQMSSLLRLSPDEYQTRSSGCAAPRLVAAVRQMRNITSSS